MATKNETKSAYENYSIIELKSLYDLTELFIADSTRQSRNYLNESEMSKQDKNRLDKLFLVKEKLANVIENKLYKEILNEDK